MDITNYGHFSEEEVVDGIPLQTWLAEFVGGNILRVEAGAEHIGAGDHGGRIYIKLSDMGSTQWQIQVNGRQTNDPKDVELTFIGDTEYSTFKNAVKFIYRVLESGDK